MYSHSRSTQMTASIESNRRLSIKKEYQVNGVYVRGHEPLIDEMMPPAASVQRTSVVALYSSEHGGPASVPWALLK